VPTNPDNRGYDEALSTASRCNQLIRLTDDDPLQHLQDGG